VTGHVVYVEDASAHVVVEEEEKEHATARVEVECNGCDGTCGSRRRVGTRGS
jgi:peptide methionine sulfoxide reductase MsrB